MATRGMGRTGLLLIRGLGVLSGGGGGGSVISGLDPQGTARLMCGARSLNDLADFVGSLNLLAGTTKLGAVGALALLGGDSGEIVGSVNGLAGRNGLELGGAMRAWALAGTF